MTTWSREENSKLLAMIAAGRGASEIARELGKSPSAVIGRAKREQVKLPRVSLHDGRGGRGMQALLRRPPPAGGDSVVDNATDGDVARVSFAELNDSSCRWPVGEPGSVGFGFCGARKVPGRSYCEAHLARSIASPVVVAKRDAAAPATKRQEARELERA